MIIRTVALIGLLVLGASATLYSPPAEARTYIDVRIAPPPPRHEEIVIREGYEWAPGYWNWNGRRYVWIGGHYIAVRPGRHWAHPYWEHRGRGWRYHEGYWGR
jgi:hypothetical protein